MKKNLNTKKLNIIIMSLIFTTFLIQSNIFAADKLTYGNLEVKIEKFESDEGNVRVHLYSSERGQYFPAKSDSCFRLIISLIKDKKATVVFDSLPFGDYALTVHHDKNLNVKMDKNFWGLPAEGWGLSNNVMPIFCLPDFDDCKFKIDKSKLTINIKVRN